LHKCFLAGGFLQTAVSDAPRRKLHVVSGVRRGASDTALAFLDNFRAADDTELTLQAPPDHNRNTGGDFTLLFSSD